MECSEKEGEKTIIHSLFRNIQHYLSYNSKLYIIYNCSSGLKQKDKHFNRNICYRIKQKVLNQTNTKFLNVSKRQVFDTLGPFLFAKTNQLFLCCEKVMHLNFTSKIIVDFVNHLCRFPYVHLESILMDWWLSFRLFLGWRINTVSRKDMNVYSQFQLTAMIENRMKHLRKH